MTAPRLCVLGFLGALVAGARAEGAIDDYLGKPIVSVRLVIEGRDTVDPALLRGVETRPGEPLSVQQVRESIAHLFSLGRFDDIRVDATLAGANGAALRYELSPIHPVTDVVFAPGAAAPGIDHAELRRAITDRYGTSPSLGRIDEFRQLLTDILLERGYLHAGITARADIFHDPDRATLVFAIDPGPRTTIGSIAIEGTPSVPRDELLRRLDLAPGAPYRRDALNTRIERYIADRRKAGYYEAKLAVTPMLVNGDRTADLRLTVMPGPHVRVVFRGDPLPAEKRDDLVPVEREGSVDEDLLEDSTNRIEDALRTEGYRDAKAPHTRDTSGGELLVTFAVTRGPEYRVDRVEISGNGSVPLADFDAALKLRDGGAFSESALDADLATIADVYHRRGFVGVKVQSAEEPQRDRAGGGVVPLRVRVVINEGPRTTVAGVRVQGNHALSEAALKEGLGLQPGRPYLDAQLLLDRDAVQQRYLNFGYPNAVVEAAANFSADRTRAEPSFTVSEGTRVFVEHVLIVGNVRTRIETIERELLIKPGDPLGDAAKVETRRRLAALGLFRRIQISELEHGDEGKRDLLVSVEESPATTIVWGVGAEGRVQVVRLASDGGAASERLEVFPRGSFDISRRNLFGKNRSVSLFTGVSVRLQKRQVFDEQGTLTSNQFGTPEYRVLGTYREPRVFNTSADAFVTGTFEQQARSSFNFARRGASAEVARQITREVGASATYQIQRTRVFDFDVDPQEQRLIDRLFPQVRLSSFSASAIRDTRDDAVDPGTGEYVSSNVQLAGRRIGSEVGFAKTFARAQLFRTLPGARRIVVAGNASFGVAGGFSREVVTTGADGVSRTVTVEDLPASERFFGGGDTTVRGFALDTLGTPDTLDTNGLPIGGNGTVIFNAEVRASVSSTIQAVGFVDAGNVFARATDIDLTGIRGALGFGVRYKSPFGPIRIDLGFKMRRDEIAGRRESLTALHISLGQAF